MNDPIDHNVPGNGPPSEAQVRALLSAAKSLRDDADAAGLEFVAYMADLTVVEIGRELERLAATAKD